MRLQQQNRSKPIYCPSFCNICNTTTTKTIRLKVLSMTKGTNGKHSTNFCTKRCIPLGMQRLREKQNSASLLDNAPI